jgi:hypothetical protein
MIKNSNSTTNHDTIRSNLLEGYIAKRYEYPVDRSEAVAMLNKYDKKKPNVQATSKGTAFTQKRKKNDKKDKNKKKSDDKKKRDEKKDGNSKKDWFADKTCYLCGKTGHGVKKCPKRATKDDNDSSISSKSSSKASSSAKKSIKQLQKKVDKQFDQLKTQIEEDKDLSSDEEQSHLQFMAVSKLAKSH